MNKNKKPFFNKINSFITHLGKIPVRVQEISAIFDSNATDQVEKTEATDSENKIKKHIIIGIRYSLLVDNPTMWVVGNDLDFNAYKNKILASDRLATREAIFKSICLPSLINIYKNKPEDVNFKVVIMTSSLLPEKNKSFLNKIQSIHPFIKIEYRSPQNANILEIMSQSIETTVKNDEVYASVRLDDDDALSLAWMNKTISYMKPSFNNMVISLAGGLAILSDKNGNIKSLANYKWRFGSAGLTYICVKNKTTNKSIYHCGKHPTLDNNYESIVYAKGKFLLRTFNDFNDSNADYPDRLIIEPKNHHSVLKDFAIKSSYSSPG